MTKKEQSARAVKRIVNIFRCPICHLSMKVIGFKSLICSNNHTFDFTRYGYINMLTRPSNLHYDKKLFEARQQIMMEGQLYSALHKKISEIIIDELGGSYNPTVIFDAGSGEGSHLQKIVKACSHHVITGIGLDIAKEGVILASKNYPSHIWIVGDLANIPLTSQSCHVILNILSPANYKEFKRILATDGIAVKVVPGPNYLKELRNALYTNKNTYTNDETVSLFKQHFQLTRGLKLHYFKELNQTEFEGLVQMSPLAWNAEKKHIDSFLHQDHVGITIDLDILIGSIPLHL